MRPSRGGPGGSRDCCGGDDAIARTAQRRLTPALAVARSPTMSFRGRGGLWRQDIAPAEWKQRMASLVLKMSISLDGYVAPPVTIEPMSTTVFSGGAVAHVFAAHS